MMDVFEFLKMLEKAHDVPNRYCNKFPQNLGYFDGQKYSFDCWNLIKAVLSGWNACGIPGSYVHTEQLVTGDVDGYTLLKNCTGRSKDFSKISVPGTYLYLATHPYEHAGVYVGDFVKDGKTYNVVECTKNMYQGQDGVTYSYVDKDGTRRPWKGGNAKLQWTDWGYLTKWVNYGDQIPKTPDKPANLDKGYLCKGDQGEDVRKAQQALLDKGYDPLGIDGIFGDNTDAATRGFQKANGLVVDGCIGPKTSEVLFKKEDIQKPAEPEAVYYTAKRGDDLTKIARRNKTTVENIIKLNPQIKNPDLIQIGDKIRIA